MSLTRAEWVEMWETVKKIDREIFVMNRNSIVTSRQFIQSQTAKIKKQIEQVIGQME